MLCEEVQELASAWLDNALPDRRARMVAAHEQGCPSCQAHVAGMRQMSSLVERYGGVPAPEGLEQRIRDALAEERGRPAEAAVLPDRWRAVARQAVAMAAVCLLSVFGTWSVLRQSDSTAAARHDVVTAHVRSLLQDSPFQVASSDSHTVRPWFNGRVEFAPPVKDLTAEGFVLAGGRLDFADGHRVATLVYKRRLHTISVFVWPEAAAGAPSQSQVSGTNVLSWSKDGLVWWAVSDLDAAELRELRALL